MFETRCLAPSYHNRRRGSMSEPISLDGPVSDEHAYYRQQSYLGAGQGALPISRNPSPLVMSSMALKANTPPVAGQEKVAMSDYFPPVELLQAEPSPTSGLHTLVVGNLDLSMTTERLTTMFETVLGFIPSFTTVKVMEHPRTHDSLGYAIVYFREERDQQ